MECCSKAPLMEVAAVTAVEVETPRLLRITSSSTTTTITSDIDESSFDDFKVCVNTTQHLMSLYLIRQKGNLHTHLIYFYMEVDGW